MSGSHTDAIPLAGMYDGTLGVIGAIAALKALKEAGFKAKRPIDAMMFTSEEPTRFGLGCIGRQALRSVLLPPFQSLITEPGPKANTSLLPKQEWGNSGEVLAIRVI